MYPVPPSAARYGATERIIGHWLRQRPGVRSRIVLATKAAGPVRGYDWLRNGSADVTADDIVASCEASLKRLQTDVIDLYQLHWPNAQRAGVRQPVLRPEERPPDHARSTSSCAACSGWCRPARCATSA